MQSRSASHIALVGLSGAGKSTVGPLLAARLGRAFVDTDREVERSAGLPVHRLFAERGEAAFRALEAREVRRALEGPPAVIALGGGALLDPESRRLVRGSATTVWLRADPAALAVRLAAVGHETRPLLAGAPPVERLRALLEARAGLYAAADLSVETDGREPGAVAAAIVRALE